MTQPLSPDGARVALLAAQRAQIDAMKFRVRTTSTNLDTGKVVTRTLELVGNDRLRIRTDRSDTIVISPTTYSTDSHGWQYSRVSLTGVLASFRNSRQVSDLNKDFDSALTPPAAVGDEVLDGTETVIYEYSVKRNDRRITSKYWVGRADGLLRKEESDAEIIASNGTTSDRTRTINLYDYDPSIAIEPPPIP